MSKDRGKNDRRQDNWNNPNSWDNTSEELCKYNNYRCDLCGECCWETSDIGDKE